jgi:hypothetical protein
VKDREMVEILIGMLKDVNSIIPNTERVCSAFAFSPTCMRVGCDKCPFENKKNLTQLISELESIKE